MCHNKRLVDPLARDLNNFGILHSYWLTMVIGMESEPFFPQLHCYLF